MQLFSSRRERRLWALTAVSTTTIYATLGIAPTVASFLGESGLDALLFTVGFVLVLAAIVTHGFSVRPNGLAIGIVLGVVAIFILLFVRTAVPAERTHLIEYSVIGLLVYEALHERRENGRNPPFPPLLAISITTLLGIIDEAIQWLLPNRVFDLRDIGFNLFAAIISVTASVLLAKLSQWFKGNS